MSKFKVVISFAIIFSVALFVFISSYKDVHFLGGLKMTYDKEQVKQHAEQLVNDLGISTKDFEATANLESNKALIRQVQHDSGFKKGNELLRNYLPGFYWQVDWQKPESIRIVMGSSSENQQPDNNKLTVVYDNHGNLLEFSRHIPDSTALPTVSEDKARKIVREFISRFGTINNLTVKNNTIPDTSKLTNYSFISGSNEEYDFKIERKVELPKRTDYQYIWTGNSSYIKDKIEMNITVSGSVVSKFKLTYKIPPIYSVDNSQTFKTTSQIIFFVIVFILLFFIAYKKIKASEIGFKLAFVISLIVFLSFGFHFFTLIGGRFRWGMMIPLLLGPLMFAAAIFLTWSASESVTREVWNEKFLSIDLLTNGYFMHSKVGESIFNGLSGGFGLTVIWLLLLFFIQNLRGIWSVGYESDLLSFFNSYSPAVSILNKYIYSSLFLLTIYFNFVVSGLRKRINSPLTLVLLAAVIWGIVNSNNIHPVFIGILLETIIGILLMVIYFRFDVLTTLITLISFYTIDTGLSLFTAGNITYVHSGYFFIGLLIILIMFSSSALFTKDKIKEYKAIVPAFEKNISERQRLQRELEIARDVQMSFLPNQSPHFHGLQVASRCLPALEVGGDYYDFVKFNDKKLGIIIGDVSGKGTQAAFYMTLTKGFLKAVSKISDSPAEVLKEMNSLFYENVERGTFISMIYGIFDMDKKAFRLARAGHNPVIVKNSSNGKIEMLNPKGIALGLEKGTIFNSTISEVELALQPDDIFVFYTDGFPEAMNKNKEEFGEDKLAEIVEQNSSVSADNLLEILFNETNKFIGKAEQHDDMTMVIIKVVG